MYVRSLKHVCVCAHVFFTLERRRNVTVIHTEFDYQYVYMKQ